MEKVVIVGGGLGGLLLALLLEKAGLDYVVLERSDVAKMPTEGGGIIPITSQIQPLLKQLELLNALQKVAKPLSQISVLEVEQGSGHQPNVVGIIDCGLLLGRYVGCYQLCNAEQEPTLLCTLTSFILRYGYYSLVIPRPELYNHLLDQVPLEKLLLGKQVQNVVQHDSVATCICTDGSRYQGIIVGADGAYSSVRQSLYRQLKDKGLLAVPDQRPLQYQYRALVGMTKPLDLDRFAMIASEHSDVRILVSRGDKPFTVRLDLIYCACSVQLSTGVEILIKSYLGFPRSGVFLWLGIDCAGCWTSPSKNPWFVQMSKTGV